MKYLFFVLISSFVFADQSTRVLSYELVHEYHKISQEFIVDGKRVTKEIPGEIVVEGKGVALTYKYFANYETVLTDNVVNYVRKDLCDFEIIGNLKFKSTEKYMVSGPDGYIHIPLHVFEMGKGVFKPTHVKVSTASESDWQQNGKTDVGIGLKSSYKTELVSCK